MSKLQPKGLIVLSMCLYIKLHFATFKCVPVDFLKKLRHIITSGNIVTC